MGEKVAFIGLGAMGGPMAQNIIKKGTKVSVFDIFNEKMDPVIKVGGTPGKSIKDTVENADIIVMMLPSTENVKAVMTDNDGVLSFAKPDTIILDMSTIAPTGTDEVYQLCQQKNRRKTHKDLRQKKLKNKMLKASLNNKMINDVHTKKKSWALPSTKKAENNVQVVPLASETEEESEAETEAETEVEAEEEKKENEIKSKLIDQNINFLGSLAGLKIHSKQLAMFDSSSDEEDSKDT